MNAADFVIGQEVEWDSHNEDNSPMPSTVEAIDADLNLVCVRELVHGTIGWTHASWLTPISAI